MTCLRTHRVFVAEYVDSYPRSVSAQPILKAVARPVARPAGRAG